MANILVTGGTGFIGQALVSKLYDQGHNISTIVRDNNSNRFVCAHNIVYGDITNFDIVRRAISQHEPNYIYHLASQAIVRQCARDPITAYQVNVMGTVNLLEAVRQCGDMVKSVVVSTSDKAYGHAPPPYNEDTPLMPKYTYEATKSCQDIVAQNYFHNYNVPTKVVRCSNVYGPGDPNTSRLIPNTIKRINQGEAPQIYKDVAEYIREWIYIDDVVDAFIKVAELAEAGENYCVGGTTPDFQYSVQAVVETLLNICNSNLVPTYPERIAKFKEIKEQYMNGDKLHQLGWSPKISLLEGLKRTVEFYTNE